MPAGRSQSRPHIGGQAGRRAGAVAVITHGRESGLLPGPLQGPLRG